jgi:hypothetical protein
VSSFVFTRTRNTLGIEFLVNLLADVKKPLKRNCEPVCVPVSGVTQLAL